MKGVHSFVFVTFFEQILKRMRKLVYSEHSLTLVDGE